MEASSEAHAVKSAKSMIGDQSSFFYSTIEGLGESQVKLKAAPSLLEKRKMFKVVVDHEDLTPDDITDPDFASMDPMAGHAAFETRSRSRDETQIKLSISTSAGAATESTTMKVYATTINLDDIHIDYTLNTEEGILDADAVLDQAPSAFYLPKMIPVTSYPKEIFVILKESQTQFLFGLPSISYEKGTPEANIVEDENTYYEYITVGKGRNRKMVHEETQTKASITQTRHTMATRPQKKNAIVFASMWDMHDTYARLARAKEVEEEDEMVLYQSAAPAMLRKKKKKTAAVEKKGGKTFDEIVSTPEFLDAVLLTERVLASLEYGDAQKKFRGLIQMDPLSLDLVYIYTLKPLWTFECADTANRPITSISFNAKNPNILAVGHGKFAYAEQCQGMICVWCTKNPCKPERLYRFKCPVTSVSFSEKNPNWLACGFWNGDVMILDITSYAIKTMATSHRDTNPCFEPMWVTNWRALDRDIEYVMTTCEDGRINRFTSTKTHEFLCTPMMRVSTVEGKLKGLETAKTCLKMDVPITRYPGVLCMMWHPSISHIYYVGTDEGCIHKCSTHYLNQHIDVFRAHAGPVYGIELSPFNKHLFVSCGADNAVRLWIEGMDDMIMTLLCPAAVYGVAFCPVNATILISVSGNVLSVWDLRRKTHIPCAEYTFSTGVVLTYISFSPSGDNVFVGDTQGRIHTFHMEDTPIPPYYQRLMLDDAIRKALCTRPQMLKQLDKLDKMRP
ncbi:dynein axonemal intermediate chain 4 [Anticarsia gemmatalis]|uniref:dynein axonemal intermediate chain 4 n=1 Tax=Anticarsia gemmatalis TaxID=129554 RepID=UPI003F772945